jgi:hypothetical protein
MRYRDYLLDLQIAQIAGFGGAAQLQQQLGMQRSMMTMQAVEDIIEAEVLRRSAQQLGIQVTPADVDAELRERFVAPVNEGETVDEAKRSQEFQQNFDRFIQQSAISREQVRSYIEGDVIREKVREKVNARDYRTSAGR